MALEVDDDTFGTGHTCFDFQRSLAVPASGCQLGKLINYYVDTCQHVALGILANVM